MSLHSCTAELCCQRQLQVVLYRPEYRGAVALYVARHIAILSLVI